MVATGSTSSLQFDARQDSVALEFGQYFGTAAGPAVIGVAASPYGIEHPGNTITFTLNLTEAATVTGTPTLSLNDGGTATYSSGSGTNTLTFSYTVGASDSSVSSLAITQANLPNGATVTDTAGNAANLTGALTTFSGLQIDPPSGPTLSSIVESPQAAISMPARPSR